MDEIDVNESEQDLELTPTVDSSNQHEFETWEDEDSSDNLSFENASIEIVSSPIPITIHIESSEENLSVVTNPRSISSLSHASISTVNSETFDNFENFLGYFHNSDENVFSVPAEGGFSFNLYDDSLDSNITERNYSNPASPDQDMDSADIVVSQPDLATDASTSQLDVDENASDTPPTISHISIAMVNTPTISNTVVTNNLPNPNSGHLNGDDTGEPPAKCAKIDLDQTSNEVNTCLICFEPWTNSGEHRLASLSCGHLFGGSCINRWLTPRPNRYCPSCKTQASLKDIRYIYATSVSYIDNSECEALRAELELAKLENVRKAGEIQKLRLNQEVNLEKIKFLEVHISKCVNVRKNSKWTFSMLKNFEIAKKGECRVFAYNKHSDSLFISQMIDNSLFPGYGLRQLDCETLKLEKVTYLHSKEIRAVSYSDNNKLLMSVSLDKQIRISNNTGIESVGITTEQRLWSCCWDREHPSRLYVGGNGVIMHYDIRQTRSCLSRIQVNGDFSTVMSVECIPRGIVTCQLQSLRIHTREGGEYKSEKLDIDGSFTNLNYDPVTEHLLVSTRPSNQIPYSKYIVCTVDSQANVAQRCNIIHTFEVASTQAIISKSCQFSIDDDHLFSMYNEADAAVNIWSVTKQMKARSLPSRDVIVDTSAWSINSDMFLGTLSKNRVQIYKLNY
ncbi:E3 ubiquitin-protein ligase rfwd3.L-like [Arctopsyche grandis]|uniref:E3 ubiquitin-protein ligase rfwd3.L-like n=1 Tax=Arctopsyche grandis TaxID=121162 RepID=UPI00406D88AA